MDRRVIGAARSRYRRPERRPRRLRWFSLFVVGLATANLAVGITAPDLLIYTGSAEAVVLGLASLAVVSGPVKSAAELMDADEREMAWQTNANLFAYGCVSIVAMIGTISLGMLGIFTLSPREIFEAESAALGFYLIALFITLPTLHLSWSMPAPIEDDAVTPP